MSKLHTLGVVAALSVATAAFAQEQQQTRPTSPHPATTQTQSGQEQVDKATGRTPGTVNPMPSTSRAEGTAADRTPPGQTETPTGDVRSPTSRSGQSQTGQSSATHAEGATSPAEGTAADRTAPGQTSRTTGMTGQGGKEIVGKQVMSRDNAPLGTVSDVVFEAQGQQPAYVIITSQGQSAAVPYSTASSMMRGENIVMDRSRLERAPKVKEGQWRNEGDSAWKNEASRYWDQG